MLLSPEVLAYVTAQPRGCCCFVAAALIGVLHGAPKDPKDEAAWARLDPWLWREVNITDHTRPWSGVDAAAQAAGGTVLRSAVPTLMPGRWYVVQRWHGLGTREPAGHTYLVQPQADGRFRVVQSSDPWGYRDELLHTWHPAGHELGVVALPTEIA